MPSLAEFYAALQRPVTRDPRYEYGSILPFRKPITGGPVEWSPQYSGLVKSVADAFTAPGRALAGEEMDPRDALNVAGVAMGGGIPGGPSKAGELGATVYHGSPMRGIEKFDLKRAGTGVGAQNQGHGIYLADDPGLATWYANTLARRNGGPEGVTYKVDLPDEVIAMMLNRDKPLSQQEAAVLRRLEMSRSPAIRDAMERDLDGGRLYQNMAAMYQRERQLPGFPAGFTEAVSGQPTASSVLRNMGIPGMRHSAENLGRLAKPGEQNYIAFDPELLTIRGTLADLYRRP